MSDFVKAIIGIRNIRVREKALDDLVKEWESGSANCAQMLPDPVMKERSARLSQCARLLREVLEAQ